MAWSWALPDGSNESTPIVHDGVMFVYGFGDVVDALNAATGDLLWEYRRRLPKGSRNDIQERARDLRQPRVHGDVRHASWWG